MKKTAARKLSLNKETVRSLERGSLGLVVGASVDPAKGCSETCYTCDSFCRNCVQ